MLTRCTALGWLAGLALALVGCETTRTDLKPPRGPEELRVPPVTDTRYSTATVYPRDPNEVEGVRPTRFEPLGAVPARRQGLGASGRGY